VTLCFHTFLKADVLSIHRCIPIPRKLYLKTILAITLTIDGVEQRRRTLASEDP
jgi:hypothetical protein